MQSKCFPLQQFCERFKCVWVCLLVFSSCSFGLHPEKKNPVLETVVYNTVNFSLTTWAYVLMLPLCCFWFDSGQGKFREEKNKPKKKSEDLSHCDIVHPCVRVSRVLLFHTSAMETKDLYVFAVGQTRL